MNSDQHDLVVSGGSVFTHVGLRETDIGIRDGRIAEFGEDLRGQRHIDAAGTFVLPGGVDMHVHFSSAAPSAPSDPRFVDDFHTGSRAAIAGGVTTFGNMSFPDEEGGDMTEAVARDLAACRDDAAVDYLLHPGTEVVTEGTLESIEKLAAAGCTTVKLIMKLPQQDTGLLLRAMQLASARGMLILLHCEDFSLIQYLTEELMAAGHGDQENWASSRPVCTERSAVELGLAMSELCKARVHVVHISSKSALASARDGRARGAKVSVETRPLYLFLTDEMYNSADAGKFTSMPPLRHSGDVEALWQGLRDGSIDTLGSDHAPWRLEQKTDPSLTIGTAQPGVAEIETMIPMLYSEGVRTGRISLEQLVSVTAANPARLFGLYPRKGIIDIGSDADLNVLDPKLSRTIDGSAMQSSAGYSVFDGREVYGWPRYTISRGEVVLERGKIRARSGRGEWLSGERFADAQ